MRDFTTARASLARFGTTALAVALACAATGAYASFASVVINDFSFTSSADPSILRFRADRHQESVLDSHCGGHTRGHRDERPGQRPQLEQCDPDGAKCADQGHGGVVGSVRSAHASALA